MRWETAFTMEASSIKFGPGVTREVGHDMSQWGVRRVMVVTDPYLAGNEPVSRRARGAAGCGDRGGAVRSGPGRADGRVVPGRHRVRRRGAIRRLCRRRRGLEHRYGQGGQPVRHLSRGVPGLCQSADRPGASGPREAEAPDRGADHGRDGERDDRRGDLRLHPAARQDGHRAPRPPPGAGPDRPGQHPRAAARRSPRAPAWTS